MTVLPFLFFCCFSVPGRCRRGVFVVSAIFQIYRGIDAQAMDEMPQLVIGNDDLDGFAALLGLPEVYGFRGYHVALEVSEYDDRRCFGVTEFAVLHDAVAEIRTLIATEGGR